MNYWTDFWNYVFYPRPTQCNTTWMLVTNQCLAVGNRSLLGNEGRKLKFCITASNRLRIYWSWHGMHSWEILQVAIVHSQNCAFFAPKLRKVSKKLNTWDQWVIRLNVLFPAELRQRHAKNSRTNINCTACTLLPKAFWHRVSGHGEGIRQKNGFEHKPAQRVIYWGIFIWDFPYKFPQMLY